MSKLGPKTGVRRAWRAVQIDADEALAWLKREAVWVSVDAKGELIEWRAWRDRRGRDRRIDAAFSDGTAISVRRLTLVRKIMTWRWA